MEIIYFINFMFLEKVNAKYPGNTVKLNSLSIIEEGATKRIRMANLCIIGSSYLNGVAQLHSDLLKTTIFKDFFEMQPTKF